MNLRTLPHHQSGQNGRAPLLYVIPLIMPAFVGIETAEARPQCPTGLSAKTCKAALAEAAQIETELEGVNVSDSFAKQLQHAPEERFRNSPCYYRIRPSLEVEITRCKSR